MKKRWAIFFLGVFLYAVPSWAVSSEGLSIIGAVKQPLQLSLNDLARFQSVQVRLNELNQDKKFHGVFNYRGVPLKELLETAVIQKGESSFIKPLDLAIVIRNREGKQTVLSWGEVFYRNPAEIVIATQAAPIMPFRDCSLCHKPEVYRIWYDPLKRSVGFPKLVVANDFYTERSLEDITSIEVIDLHLKLPTKKVPELFAPALSIVQNGKQILSLSDLSSYPRLEVPGKVIGDGKGYHGHLLLEGVPLMELLKRAGITPALDSALVISAPDGYRSLISAGELLLNPLDRRIIIADRLDGRPIKADGKFKLVIPDDLSADRWVKAVSRIEVINLHRKPKAYVDQRGLRRPGSVDPEGPIGHGPGRCLRLLPMIIKKRFASYIGERPVLFDPFKYLMPEPIYGKELAKLSPEEKKRPAGGKDGRSGQD